MAGAQTLTLIGAGRMGTALLRGWLASGLPGPIRVLEPQPGDELKAWATSGRVRLNPDPQPSALLVMAVKPQQFTASSEVARLFAGPETLAVSIMAGVKLAQLSRGLGTARVIRAMPNTPGAIGRGVTAFAAPEEMDAAGIAEARRLLAPLGEVHGPVDEALMPAVTALSGSGPAYLFLLAETMAAAGEAEGLPRELAEALARRTVEGAAALLAQSGEAPDALRRAVTSPGGTTQAALDILMGTGGMPDLLKEAIRAAASRDRQLSKEAG
ncbi:pyrroline-5-carboxylate reductase [Hyphomonas sp.]|uniref:pyrroline-5-carboxylate reductase n=1 Tax=Hyphomonas sp. TaxID=87 RepID=UPI0039190BDB